MKKHQENILVVSVDNFEKEYTSKEFGIISYEKLKNLLNRSTFHPRYKMEEDQSYKQIIPYVVVMDENNKVLTYKRSSKGGENRLHDKYSIGVGGHLDVTSEMSNLTGIDIYKEGLAREVKEELNITSNPDDFTIEGFLYDDSNDVGKVHFGVVSFLKVNSSTFAHDGELDILVDRSFLSKEELIEKYDSLENWSKIVFDNLIKNMSF